MKWMNFLMGEIFLNEILIVDITTGMISLQIMHMLCDVWYGVSYLNNRDAETYKLACMLSYMIAY